jgi:hypothetical protein
MAHIRIPTFSDTGESLDIANFVYDPTGKRWEHRLRVAQQMVQKYTTAVVSDNNFVEIAKPLLAEKGFVQETAQDDTSDQEEAETAPLAAAGAPVTAPERTGKRGRQSKYPYRTMQIGESFLIDKDSVGVTFNNSLLGDRAFQIEVVGGRFKVTRTK